MKKQTTKQWLATLSDSHRNAFFDNMHDMKTHELIDWITDLMPLDHAMALLENITEHWDEDEVGTPYRSGK